MTASDEICPVHDWPRFQCPPECTTATTRARPGWVEAPPPDYDGPRPTAQSILISETGIAHRLGGCTSLPGYEYLVPPKWGWIDDSTVWSRIGNHEIRATEGNTKRVAVRRCTDCD